MNSNKLFEKMLAQQLAQEEAKTDNNLRQCPSCSKSFNPESFQKHVKICDKVFG